MSALDRGARGAVAQVKRWAASSAWTPLAGRAAAYLFAFVLLALVGSGRLARWLTPPPRLGIGVAEAATTPPPPRETAVAEAPGAQVPDVASETAIAEVASGAKGAGAAPAGAAPAEKAASPPPVAEAASTAVDAGAAPPDPAGASKGVASDGKIILNLATEEDLRKLPKVGHAKAQAILALRAQMKKFTRVEDLLKVKGVSRRALARLRPLVRLD